MPTPTVPPPLAPPATLEITEVRIQLQDAKALRAFVSITLNDSFVIRGLKVIDGADGYFVAMPARRRKDGTFQDIAHPIVHEFREYLESVVLRLYFEEVERDPNGSGNAV